jgi:myo-inositol 2-dehydrogenase/D-chiro-inositol 1-dehydrogenase
MTQPEQAHPVGDPRLRSAVTKGVAAGAVAGLGLPRSAHAAGSDTIRIALVGCGGRGGGAASNALSTQANVRLIAMADAFEHRLQGALKALQGRHQQKVDVPPERQFVGLDAYKQAIDSDADLVLLATPPGFRPMQFEAAVEAGKHIFMEKPVAVDAPGVRRILAANKVAKQKGLAVAVGHHLRHEKKHIEVVKRIHDGLIGDVKLLRAYFNSSGVWVRPRKAGQTEMQYQVQNWYYFNWLSGDHITEQHVHDLDVCNWIMHGPPAQANGMGGRQVRIGPDYGEIFDHHFIEFTYADGTKMLSQCRHIRGCFNSFSEHAQGTLGYANIQGHGKSELVVKGQEPLGWSRERDGHQTEMDDLMPAILAGRPYNEGDYGASSTMTAIFGRMATYSGKVVPYEDAINSEIDLSPSGYEWDSTPQPKPGPGGIYPCAIPGVTKAV